MEGKNATGNVGTRFEQGMMFSVIDRHYWKIKGRAVINRLRRFSGLQGKPTVEPVLASACLPTTGSTVGTSHDLRSGTSGRLLSLEEALSLEKGGSI